jgi:hypothetical protein
MFDEAEGKNLELIIKALSAALHDANIGMPEIVFRDRCDFKTFRMMPMHGSDLTRAGAIEIDGIQITDVGHDARAIDQARREGYAAGVRAAAEVADAEFVKWHTQQESSVRNRADLTKIAVHGAAKDVSAGLAFQIRALIAPD